MTSLLLTLHQVDAYLAIVVTFAGGVYGLGAHRQHPHSLSQMYGWALIAGGSILSLQVFIGLALLASGLRPADNLHIFIYGALSPIILPGAYLYVRGRGRSHPNLAYGLVCLFLAAFLTRTLFTA
ncbi:MAG: hypothetical protein HY532_03485 [Chloroflexi bacterium]|nr:hypothetical protein [Chloroflexota bacterium]